MTKETEKDRLKKEFKRLFKNMDFVCDNHLNKEGVPEKEQERFADIYQQLGQVWEFLSLQCKHWDGYKKNRKKDLKHFPVIFKFDDDFKFLGLTIIR
jgi:hypothetical protein